MPCPHHARGTAASEYRGVACAGPALSARESCRWTGPLAYSTVARCRQQHVICRRCDRGQRYCSARCATAARSATQRAAGARYQDSRRGRITHAARQRCYRARRQKVTHQGSAMPAARVSLPAAACAANVVPPALLVAMTTLVCLRCASPCAPFLRGGFLPRRATPPRSPHPRRVPRPSG